MKKNKMKCASQIPFGEYIFAFFSWILVIIAIYLSLCAPPSVWGEMKWGVVIGLTLIGALEVSATIVDEMREIKEIDRGLRERRRRLRKLKWWEKILYFVGHYHPVYFQDDIRRLLEFNVVGSLGDSVKLLRVEKVDGTKRILAFLTYAGMGDYLHEHVPHYPWS